MLRDIIVRPIAVTMSLIAIAILGLLALQKIPVSLMPDIDIPRITVQIPASGYAAPEVEQRYVTPMRQQLAQVAGLKSIESTSRMDAGTITMEFETGSNMSLIFIDVNEKLDRAMNNMPKEMERPKVMKASAMDVPAFYLDIYLKDKGTESAENSELSFAQLGKFVKGVASKRIEQLPQTAMVDMSGTVGTEIECTPDNGKLKSLGMTVQDIEQAIRKNNITLGALSVRDGIYRFNIHFDSQLLTKEDVENIYINHEGRLLQLKDLCSVTERVAQRNGLIRHDGKNAITLAIIKQNDAQMEDLQESMDGLLEELRASYPDIEFQLTRDQTRLLTYTIDNLKGNLWVGALLAFLIILLFMRQWRMSILIAISVPLSLILTLLAFYLCGITLNVISLSGLVLGVGMIVDNSIIVIDNIMQKWRSGLPMKDAVALGTKEVCTPMLSSVLTTCSVFIPLIFLSGTAGALFYDQAMGVTFALFASLLVAVTVVPVYFYAFFRKKTYQSLDAENKWAGSMIPPYEIAMRWVLKHGGLCMTAFFCIIPLTVLVFQVIEKDRMPYIAQDDTLMTIDWNQGISTEENDRRVTGLLQYVKDGTSSSTAMVGTQDFLLAHTKDITSSEAVVYLKCASEEQLGDVKTRILDYIRKEYGDVSVEFGEPGNLYDLIFSTDEADLNILLQTHEGRRPAVRTVRSFVDSLKVHFPQLDIMPVVTETNIRYVTDPEQMTVYKVSYDRLLNRLKEIMNRNQVFEINDGAQSVPVIIGADVREARLILSNTVLNDDGTEIPISYLVKESQGEDYKRLQSSDSGEYFGISLNAKDRDIKNVMSYVDEYTHRPDSDLSAAFSGGYFSSRQMIGEMTVVLVVALALLFFILAAQFESLVQPLIILLEMVVDVFFVLLGLWLLGESLNIMSMIGIVVMSGIVINDSILKIDTINRLRREGNSIVRAIWVAGHSRLRPIVMTSLTTILALLPFLTKGSMGAAMQYPLSLALVIGMTVGTLVSLFFVPLLYYVIYRRK